MATEEQENFLRLAIVIVDHAKDSFIELLNLHLSITKQSFEHFINLHRHEILHLFDSRRCCKCLRGSNPQRRTRVIQKPQMALLFGRSSCGKHEFCCCVAKPGISTSVLDMTLAKCLLINFCSDVFWYSCLDYAGLTFEQYLNNRKHDIYHLWQHNTNCCECDPYIPLSGKPFLDKSQWNQMYSSTSTPCNSHRKRPVSGSVTCICSMTAKSGISLLNIDDCVKDVLIKQFCSVRLAIDFLATTRNESYGHVSEGQIPNAEYQTLMSEVEKSITEIAKVCNKENEFKSKLELGKTKALDTNRYNRYRDVMLEIMTQHLAIDECLQEIGTIKGKLANKSKLIKSVPGEIAAKIPRLMEESTKPLSDAFQEGTFQQLELVEKYGNKLRHQSELTRLMLERHKRLLYVKNDAVRQCMAWIMDEGDVVILYGRKGSGKTSTGLEILKQIQEKDPDYFIVRVSDISQINEILNEGVKIALLMDDIYCECACGMNKTWNAVLDQLGMCKGSVALKLILTIESKLMKSFSEHFYSKLLFKNILEINLESKVYNFNEKATLLSVFCARFNISLSQERLGNQTRRCLDRKIFDAIVKLEPYEPLPLAFESFTSKTDNFELGIDYFKHPSKVLLRSVVKLKDSSEKFNLLNRIKYLILFFIFKEGPFTIKKEADLNNIQDMLSSGCSFTELKALVKEAVQGIEEKYIVSKGDQFQFVHRMVYEAVAIAHYEDDQKTVIMVADLAFLFNKMQLKSGKHHSVNGAIYIEPELYGCFEQRLKTIFMSDYQMQVECFVESLCCSLVIRQDNTGFYRPFLKHLCFNMDTNGSYYLPIIILHDLIKIGVPNSIRCTVEMIKCDITKTPSIKPFCFAGFKRIVKYVSENKVDNHVVEFICKTLIDVNVEIDLTPFVVTAIERGGMAVGGMFLTFASSLVTFVHLIDALDDTYIPHLTALLSTKLLNNPCSQDKTIVLQWLISQSDALSLNIQKEAESAFRHQFPELAMWIIETFPTKVTNVRALIEVAAGSGWEKHAITMIKTNHLTTDELCHISKSVCSASIQEVLLKLNMSMNILPVGVSIEDRIKVLEEFLPHFVNISKDINKHMIVKEIVRLVGENVMQCFTLRLFVCFIIATTNCKQGHQINRLILYLNLMLPLDPEEVQNINKNTPWCYKQEDLLMLLMKHYKLPAIDWGDVLSWALNIDKENDEGLSLTPDNKERDRTQGKTLVSIQLVKSVGLEAFDVRHCFMEGCLYLQTDFIKFLCNDCNIKKHAKICWTNVIDMLPMRLHNDKTQERAVKMVRYLVTLEDFPFDWLVDDLITERHFDVIKLLLEDLGHAKINIQRMVEDIYKYSFVKDVDKNAEDLLIHLLINFHGEMLNAKVVMRRACELGHFEVVKILLEKVDHASLDIDGVVNTMYRYNRIVIEYDNDDDEVRRNKEQLMIHLLTHVQIDLFDIRVVMKSAFVLRHLEVVKILLEKVDHASLDITGAVNEMCYYDDDKVRKSNEHLIILKYLMTNVQIGVVNTKYLMGRACICGHFEFVKILVKNVDHASLDIAEAVNKMYSYDTYTDILMDDIDEVRRNQEHLMLYLLTNTQIDLFDTKKVMSGACIFGHLEVFKLFIDRVDHGSLDEVVNEMFIGCNADIGNKLSRNNEHLILLILTNFPIDLFDTKELMRWVCALGHLQVVKILIEKVDNVSLDIAGAVNEMYYYDDDDDDEMTRNKEQLLIYLLTQFHIDLFDTNEVMRCACQFQYIEVVKILLEKFDHASLDIAKAVNGMYHYYDDDDDEFRRNDDDEVRRNEQLLTYLLTNVQIDLVDTKYLMRRACKLRHLEVVKILVEKVDHASLDIAKAVNEMYHYDDDDDVRRNDEQLMTYLLTNVQINLFDTKQVMRGACEFGHLKVVKILVEKVDHASLGLMEMFNLLFQRQHQKNDRTHIIFHFLSHVNIALFDTHTVIRNSYTIWEDVRKVMANGPIEPHDNMIVNVCKSGYTSFGMWIINNYFKNKVQAQKVYHEVFRSCSVELVSVLLKEVNDIDVVKANNKACLGDNISVVQYMFATYPPGTFNLDKCFITACSHGSVVVAEWLITLEIPVSSQEEGLIQACRYGREGIVESLIQRLTFKEECIQDAVTEAITNKDCDEYDTEEICRMLSDEYEDKINFYNLMTEACKCCRFDIIKYFVKEIPAVDLKHAFDCILMMTPGPSDRCNFERQIQSLVNDTLHKTKLETLDLENVILKICNKGYVEVLKSFCHERKQPFPFNTALKTASVHGQRAVIDWLLRSFPHDTTDLKSLVVDACGYGWVEIIKDHKDVLSSCLSDCIAEACSFGRKETVDFIIELDLKISEVDMNVILKTSCEYGWEDIFRWVIEKKNNISFDIEKCISEACLNGNTTLVKRLYNLYGSEKFEMDLIYGSILESKTNGDVLDFLLSTFGFLNLDPTMVLFRACNFGWTSVFSITMDWIDGIDDFHALDICNAFLKACDNGENEIVRIILERYPSVKLDVKRAMEISCEKGWDEIVHVLMDKIEHERLDVGECLFKACEAGEAEIVDVIFKNTDVNSLDLTSCLEKSMDNPLNEQTVLVILKQLGLSMRKYDVERVKQTASKYSWSLVLSYLTDNKVS